MHCKRLAKALRNSATRNRDYLKLLPIRERQPKTA